MLLPPTTRERGNVPARIQAHTVGNVTFAIALLAREGIDGIV
jgi:hypothetical protein